MEGAVSKELLSEKPYIAIVEFKKVEYLIRRNGYCIADCKAACCKFIHMRMSKDKYFGGFGKYACNGFKVDVKCRYLKRNLCSRWNKLPNPCKQFPNVGDPVYILVHKQCGFSFDIIRRLEKKIED